jgi:trigger factor
MQVSVEQVGALERRMTISVDEAQIDSAIEKELEKLSKRVKIKGFRAGKVPLKVVKQHYGNEVRMQVLQDVMQSSFYDALQQEQLHPAGQPTFDPKMSDQPGDGFEYTATFEVYPEIKLANLSGVKIERPVSEITDADLDEMLKTIQKQHISWKQVDRAAKQEDRVTIDFTGEIDGEAFQGGSGSDMAVEIGKGQLIAGFEDGLVGLKEGDDKVLDLAFPEEYHNKELAGKPVKFNVTVKKVEEPELPPVDAELAKKLGIEEGDVEKLKTDVRNNMQRELTAALDNKTKSAVMDKLLELNPIEAPSALIDSEARNVANQMAQNLVQQGMPADKAQLDPSAFKDEAKRRVTLGLILAEIVKQQDIKASDEAVRARVDKIAEPYEQSEQVVQWYYGDKKRLAEIESLVLEQSVVDWVLEQADIQDKAMNFNELMYPNQNKND